MQYQNQLNEIGETQLLTTDPEARVMHSKDEFHCCYNVQSCVDKGTHLIAEYEVTNNCNDQGLLKSVSDLIRKTLEMETIKFLADKVSDSRWDIEDCLLNGIIPNVALKYDKDKHVHTTPYVEAGISKEDRKSTKPKV